MWLVKTFFPVITKQQTVCVEVHTLVEGFAPGCCFISLGNEEYLSSISYAKFTQDSHQ